MDAVQVGQMQEMIVRDLMEQAPPGWTQVRAAATSIDGYMQFSARADVPGQEPDVMWPDTATIVTSDLSEAMYKSGKGTWFSMACTVEPSGEYHFTFNYDQPATFGDREPAEESWINDLRRHPRDWDNIPDWHLVKQRYTEDEWLASVQRYKDWLASDDQSPFTG
ncbi:hypothetical protein [Janibacter indicus]|uniref:Uncharacterized protein n=1 Tax=Janibacter indicus TaxID=857417 RepID=A0A1W2CEI3_9MICO|nr:hypothetical protein [Janibacter indicus]SMC83466.1 hypothetical protein SAMN06296429_11117 [Janibacter indicus]